MKKRRRTNKKSIEISRRACGCSKLKFDNSNRDDIAVVLLACLPLTCFSFFICCPWKALINCQGLEVPGTDMLIKHVLETNEIQLSQNV